MDVSKKGSDAFCKKYEALCPDQFWKDNMYIDIDDDQRKIVYQGHFPAGISLKNYIHYAQIIRAEKFQNFDYGDLKNIKTYGNENPPVIDLAKIKLVPYTVWMPSNDLLSSYRDNYWSWDLVS